MEVGNQASGQSWGLVVGNAVSARNTVMYQSEINIKQI